MQCNLGDFTIYYESYGSGRPIVTLPGIPSDHGIMERCMEPLFTRRDGWLRLYPDLPGTGRTPGADRFATNDQMLAAMLAFIDTVIPGQRFVLAGLSYGGYMARGVVHHRAASIDGLLLCAPMITAPPAHLPPRTTLVEDPASMARLNPGIASLVVVQTPRVAETVLPVQAEVELADHSFLERLEEGGPFSFDADRLPAPFSRPTLILTGRQDNICGYRDAWDLLDTYPRATFAVLDRSGHFLNIEQDALCHTLINEWLDRVAEYAPA